MSFSKETCLFVIRNAALIEKGLIEAVQQTVFTAMNAHLEKRLKALGGWKGKYELVTVDNETAFAPVTWPESQDGRYRACYKLTEAGDQNHYWLSNTLGVNGVKMCLQFWVHGGLGGRSKGEVGRKLLTVASAADIKAARFVQGAEENTLNLPFVFDAEVLAGEYPTVDKALAPLDTAIDKLLKVHPLLDAAVQELTAKR